MASSVQAARGPIAILLSSSGAQWMALGCIGLYGFLQHDGALELLRRAASQLAAKLPPPAPTLQNQAPAPGPIVLNLPSGRNERVVQNNPLLVVVQYGIGVYAVYYLFQNVLPEQLKQMLPVNRKVFDSATKSLTKAVMHVKETLGEQVLGLLQKQDDLAAKQDETGNDVKEIKEDVKRARGELADLSDSIHRCEDSLDDTHRLQSYTSRGVGLLIDVVISMLPENARMSKELRDYQSDGDRIRQLQEKLNTSSAASRSLRNSPEEGHPQSSIARGYQKPTVSPDDMNRYLFGSEPTHVLASVQPKNKHARVEITPNEKSMSPEEEHPKYAHGASMPNDSYLNSLLREFH